MKPLRVVVACEFSGTVRDAFAALGHDAWSCDLLPSERPGNHLQCDARSVLNDSWDLLIAHPPCTYLSNSGVRHLHEGSSKADLRGAERMVAMRDAADFFLAFKQANIPRICIENPVPHKYARAIIGKYQQLIQPWEFGHGETKATCLWLKGLPPLMATIIDTGREHRIHKEPPGPNRWKNRSRTYEGIANAMAAQFGGYPGQQHSR